MTGRGHRTWRHAGSNRPQVYRSCQLVAWAWGVPVSSCRPQPPPSLQPLPSALPVDVLPPVGTPENIAADSF